MFQRLLIFYRFWKEWMQMQMMTWRLRLITNWSSFQWEIKVKDTKFLKAYSTSSGLTTIQINKSKHSGAVVCEICSLSVTSMAALERHQKAKHSNMTYYFECWIGIFFSIYDMINLHHICMKHEIILNQDNKGKLNMQHSTVCITRHLRKLG